MQDSTSLTDIERLVEPVTRGDPMRTLRWTSKSLRHLSQALQAKGHSTAIASAYGRLNCKSEPMSCVSRLRFTTCPPAPVSGTRSSIVCFHLSLSIGEGNPCAVSKPSFNRATCKIPLRLHEASGHDFSRAASSARRCWALAPASFCFQLFAVQQRLKPESEWAFCGTTEVVP